MLILHTLWLPDTALALWAETTQPTPANPPKKSSKGATHLLPHPFAANRKELVDLLPVLTLKNLALDAKLTLQLPTVGAEPEPSSPFLRESAAKAGKPALAAWEVPALALRPAEALTLLLNLRAAPGLELGADVAFWQTAGRWALDGLVGGRYQPTIVEEKKSLAARWRPTLEASDGQTLDCLTTAMPPACRAWGTGQHGPRAILTNFLEVVVDALAREHADFDYKFKAHTTLAEDWLFALQNEVDATFEAPADFLKQYRAWAQVATNADSNFRLCFRLEPPTKTSGASVAVPNATAREWAVRYFLQATDDPSLLVPATTVWGERGHTLKYLNRRFEQPQEKLLQGLGLAARVFAPIETSLRAARPEHSALTLLEAHAFIREAALLLQGLGFGILLPNLSTQLGVKLKLSEPQRKSAKSSTASLTFDRVIEFNWELALGDQLLSRAEFERLATLKVPLVQIRGEWVELQPEQLQQALYFLEQREKNGELSLEEALRLALNPQAGGLPVTAVEASGWVQDWLAQLTDQAQLKPLPAPASLRGTLRHYQASGFAWLNFLRQYGFGACLADDMGLGKTIQTLALLLHLKETNRKKTQPALLVCPTSVVSNWQREAQKFAPALHVLIHHGSAREKAAFAKTAQQHDLVITSYALLPRDLAELKKVTWREVVLDEAQNIKNPDTKQAKAARALPAEHRIALTGTPVENRLSELWSIFHFLNPGYLGAQAAFSAQFARPIERLQDTGASERLKALISPFILRRVKTDPKVIQDLPAKNEMKVFCSLTREQATLYQAVVKNSLRQIEESEGIQRRGLVLSTLLRLKQVCNHPAQFLADGSALPDRSGKLNRLGEMLEEVQAVGERALVFTQFSEMGALLQSYLQTKLGGEVLFLHGGTPAKARARMVERFQEDPHGPGMFILSIKAGGTGLNLTRANHVFHFDRWWNPAVENQATDRAFRIGQTRNVQVHKFLCAGTLEEKIDAMIERKSALANSIVGTSESWITEMTTDQLREMFTLRTELVE